MKRQARVQEDEEEDEEEEENEEDNNMADSLQIFCCSATEYQKIQNPLPDDGPPNVRSTGLLRKMQMLQPLRVQLLIFYLLIVDNTYMSHLTRLWHFCPP